MTSNNEPTLEQQVEAMKARQLMGRLKACEQSGARYLERDMEGAKIKLELRPDFKEVLQDVAHMEREYMATFARIAIEERMLRILGQRITEGEPK